MPDQSADRLEMIAAARLQVALDHRLGRPTPQGVIRLSLSADDLDQAEPSRAKDTELRWAGPARPPAEPSRRWRVAAALPAIPLLLVIVLEAWWRADSPVPLLVAIGAAVVTGALPVHLLGRLLSTGIWSAASPTLLAGAWLGLVPGAVGDNLGANAFGTAVIGAVTATALIALLGAVQTAVGVPRFATRPIHDDSPYAQPVGLHPLVRHGMAAAGYGIGAVLYSVLAGWPVSAGGFDRWMFAVTIALTALAFTVAAVGVQLAATLVLRRTPRFGPVTLGTTFVLLTLWQMAVLGNSWWQLAGCVVVLAAASYLAVLVRQRVLPLDGYVEPLNAGRVYS